MKKRHFLFGKIARLTGLQIGREFEGIQCDSRQGFDAEPDLCAHLANLAVSAFAEGKMESVARTELAVVQALDVFDAHGFCLVAVFESHRFLQLTEGRFVEDAADLDGVEFGMAVARVSQAVDEGAIGREDQETVGIAIEASGGEKTFRELPQAGKDAFSVGFVGGAEQTARLIEDDGTGTLRFVGREDLFTIHADDSLVRILEAIARFADDGAIDGDGAAGDDSGAMAAGSETESCENALESGRFADGIGLFDERRNAHDFGR